MKKNQFYFIVLLAFFGLIYGYITYFFVPSITQKQIRDIEKRCAKETISQSAKCYRFEFKRVIRSTNLKEIMNAVVTSEKVESSAILDSGLDCHGLSHIIGETAGSMQDAHGYTLIPACGSSCGYGCTHGVVMGMIKSDPARINHLEELCNQSGKKPLSEYDKIACFHGLGHGIAEFTRYNAAKAAARCNTFGTRDSREECMSGVFMEVYSPADKNHENIPIPTDLFADCNGLRDTSLVYCKRMMITSLYRSNQEISVPFRLCHQAVPEKEGDCVLTLGADAYFVEHEQISKILNLCRLSGSFYENCVEGIVSSSITIHQDDQQAKEICKAAGSDTLERCTAYTKYRMNVMGTPTP